MYIVTERQLAANALEKAEKEVADELKRARKMLGYKPTKQGTHVARRKNLIAFLVIKHTYATATSYLNYKSYESLCTWRISTSWRVKLTKATTHTINTGPAAAQ